MTIKLSKSLPATILEFNIIPLLLGTASYVQAVINIAINTLIHKPSADPEKSILKPVIKALANKHIIVLGVYSGCRRFKCSEIWNLLILAIISQIVWHHTLADGLTDCAWVGGSNHLNFQVSRKPFSLGIPIGIIIFVRHQNFYRGLSEPGWLKKFWTSIWFRHLTPLYFLMVCGRQFCCNIVKFFAFFPHHIYCLECQQEMKTKNKKSIFLWQYLFFSCLDCGVINWKIMIFPISNPKSFVFYFLFLHDGDIYLFVFIWQILNSIDGIWVFAKVKSLRLALVNVLQNKDLNGYLLKKWGETIIPTSQIPSGLVEMPTLL